MNKGFTADIFKHEGRSCDGVAEFSSKCDQVTILASLDFPDIPAMCEPTNDAPAVMIVRRQLYGKEYLTAYPVDVTGMLCRNRMFGGCFIKCCDSRFPALYPIPLHDRLER
jgi:hypothetical protein